MGLFVTSYFYDVGQSGGGGGGGGGIDKRSKPSLRLNIL